MDSKGVLVAEVLTTASSTNDLKNWAGAKYDYLLFRTEPAKQIVTDFAGSFVGYPTLPVIDLRTMKVVHMDCNGQDWETCIEKYL